MRRFILTYQGYGDSPDDVESRLKSETDVTVTDRFGDNIVIEGRSADVKKVLKGMKGWFSAAERSVKHPGKWRGR